MLLASKGTCNERSVSKWLKIVYFAHKHGYLYCGFDEDDNIDLTAIAYKIRHIKEQESNEIPLKDGGNILYVSAVASMSRQNMKLFRLMKWYLKNNLEINLIAYDHNNSIDLKVFDIRRNKKHGKKISPKN